MRIPLKHKNITYEALNHVHGCPAQAISTKVRLRLQVG
jgi:hypothetical protein